ncbi:unnamed protein product [Hermetia illucens]|uniref:PiggyBac transposable element-derived protein domain-containing protein n=1 Tax=Hermetia illucens TaxID=343691 RepID=A0A7R8U9H2_HERIL|nr:unnamed protein product [Hermetia illucens]
MSNLFDFDPREDDEEKSAFHPFETSSDDEEYLPEPGENDESSEYESDDDVVDNEPQQHETTCSEPKEFVLSKDGKYCYYFEPPPQLPNRSNASFALHETPGRTLLASSRCTDILSSFLLFMEPIEKTIVEMTNLYGSRKYKELWLPVDIASLRAYYGLLILAGVYRSHGQCINELWDDQTGPPIFRATMTLKKFKLINECIRFDDKEQRKGIRSRDKLAPIRNVYDKWVNRLKMCYTVGKNVTVDEQLVPFRGRCPFTQYIPSKPHKYGIKIWCLCDAKPNMEKKRPLTQNEMEYYANLSDSEFDEMFDEDDNDSSDYEPSDNSSDSEDMVVSECEVDPEPEDNNDDSQTTTSNANDDLWTEIQQNSELFIFQENIGVKLDTANFTVHTLVDLFFSDEFLALLVEQTNLYAAQEMEKRKVIKKITGYHSGKTITGEVKKRMEIQALNTTISELYAQQSKAKQNLKAYNTYLKLAIEATSIGAPLDQILGKIHRAFECEVAKKRKAHKSKWAQLTQNRIQKQNLLLTLSNYVINKSSIEFTPRKLTALNNGLGYALAVTIRLEEAIVNNQAGIKWLSNEKNEEIRSGIAKI